MKKLAVLIGSLLLCSGCAGLPGRSMEAVQTNTVMMEVYSEGESESVMGSVYEPSESVPLKPKLPDTATDPYAAPLTDT
ncbi:hypothetical protein [Paenibacillus spongiae]|uniref:Uncharacterized protein n=1 Tax=Paenibacillus spongiae TaxID=2909671 RepID=A0ABY5SE42_9BACL|nr:hypothetical protein [Paenibacillus spongiae]UVI32237.1 hypothetical protein L1F29_10655 [Paenibacillus spongiae]